MIVVGLTGGIGSGKSTVAPLLARGAALVDTDDVSREAVAPGTDALVAITERFGDGVLGPNGQLDRRVIGTVVFADDRARADLEAIVWPAVRARVRGALDELRAAGRQVAIVVIPLLVDNVPARARYGLDGVLVVDAPEELALDRLVASGRLDAAGARARLAVQPARAVRIANGDFVICNYGDLAELEEMTRRAWDWITGLDAEPSNPTDLTN